MKEATTVSSEEWLELGATNLTDLPLIPLAIAWRGGDKSRFTGCESQSRGCPFPER
jgi:hypothetical protein